VTPLSAAAGGGSDPTSAAFALLDLRHEPPHVVTAVAATSGKRGCFARQFYFLWRWQRHNYGLFLLQLLEKHLFVLIVIKVVISSGDVPTQPGRCATAPICRRHSIAFALFSALRPSLFPQACEFTSTIAVLEQRIPETERDAEWTEEGGGAPPPPLTSISRRPRVAPP
jgi:hypothetical protein